MYSTGIPHKAPTCRCHSTTATSSPASVTRLAKTTN